MKAKIMDQYGLIGNPIHHSKSPEIHRLFAAQTKQSIDYSLILVDLDGLEDALTKFQSQGGKGINITLPFKHKAYSLVDTLSDRAKRAKAVNTIKFNEDGTRFGDNTDGIGLVRDIINNFQCPLFNKRILILGAGGAVRGILEPILNEKPANVVIINRTEKKAFDLAEEFANVGPICAAYLSSIKNETFDLVINGTSASLLGDIFDLPQKILRGSALCYDMAYGKGVTPFLSWAKEQRAECYTDGLGMLVEQASESFFLWRNIKPDTQSVLSFLKNKSAGL